MEVRNKWIKIIIQKIFTKRKLKEIQRLRRILTKLKRLISKALYNLYQREREDLFIDDEKELGNNAEEIKEYPDERRY